MNSNCQSLQSHRLAANDRGRMTAGIGRDKRLLTLVVPLVAVLSCCSAVTAEEANSDNAEVISKENTVDAAHLKAEWQPAFVGQKLVWRDRVRTGEDSRAALRLSDFSILRLDELTEAEILPPTSSSDKATLDVKQGTSYFFSREKSREINVQTPAANGGVRGTEFIVNVAADGTTSFIMIEGEVEASNGNGSVTVHSGERADIQPGVKPVKTNESKSLDSAQWCFYYPGVLDPKEVMASIPDRGPLEASLSAYNSGDLLNALQEYPKDRLPASPEEKVYRASLLLISGQAAKAEKLLEELDANQPGRQAISTLIAAITLKEKRAMTPPQTAGEFMADSYYRQSQGDLAGAEQSAKHAIDLDPAFGFGWTRLAEVEFALGRTVQSKKALEKGLTLTPNNPAAHALRGSILAAEGKLEEANYSFDRALALNSSLGDAWAGRGLCFIREGKLKEGRRDLFTAAALEPNRKIFRKYLAEAMSNSPANASTNSSRNAATEKKRASDNSKRTPAKPTPARDNTAGQEPVYEGRIPGSGSGVNPSGPPIIITFPSGSSSSSKPPRGSGTQSHPEGDGESPRTPTPSKTHDHPGPSRHPEQRPPPHRPTPTPTPTPSRRIMVPGVLGNQGQTPIRRKQPTPAESPGPN